MKKYYEAPTLDLLALLTGDVVTLSIGIASEDDGKDDNLLGERTQSWRYQ